MIGASGVRFPAFRENRDEYLQSQREWSEVFGAALKPTNRAGWEDWLRDPFFEGTPIFSRVDRGRKTGVVINQILPADDELRFRAYLDDFGSTPDEQVAYLAITCILTEASKENAGKLINAYLVHKLPPREMAQLCEALTDGHVNAS